jgi:hypothetical protein
MRIECRHGYFVFEELEAGELSQFSSIYGLDFIYSGDHYTFTDLAGAPNYSLPGGSFLGAPTIVAFEGHPWEVMRANGLIYNFILGAIVPLLSVVQTIRIQLSGNIYISNGMILPGSVTDDGSRVTDYAAFYDGIGGRFQYSEVEYA